MKGQTYRMKRRKTDRRFGGWAALVLTGIWLLGLVPAAGAERFVRKKKDGVIYYYFNDRGQIRAQTEVSPPPRRAMRPSAAVRCSPQELNALIHEASRHHGLPPSLVKALIRVESNFDPAATSPKGAQGLMQLMPKTAEELAVANPYDIRENVWGGTRYLWMMLKRFDNRLHLALAAYNAGPQRVEAGRAVPQLRETQDFVRDVCSYFLQYRPEDTTPSQRPASIP